MAVRGLFFVLLLVPILAAEESSDEIPPDDLVLILVKQLITVEHADDLCVARTLGGGLPENLPTPLFAKIQKAFPKFCTSQHKEHLFEVGPLSLDSRGKGTIGIKRVLSFGGCTYPIEKKRTSWKVRLNSSCFTID